MEVCQYNTTQTSKENQRCVSYFLLLRFVVCCELRICQPFPKQLYISCNTFIQELFGVTSFVIHFSFLKTNLNLLNKKESFLKEASAIIFIAFEIYD